MGLPFVPRSIVNPVGGTDKINNVIKKMDSALDEIQAWFLSRVEQIPTNKIIINSLFVNDYRYDYQISIPDLEQLVNEMFVSLETVPDDYTAEQVAAAYLAATALAVLNLQNITKEYTRTVTTVLISDEYQRRVALVIGGVMDELKAFKAEIGRDLAAALRESVQDGLSPSKSITLIKEKFEKAKRKAERIANTEITNAIRDARLDEAQDAEKRLGLRIRMLWISALRPTTRPWHAIRHGKAYTVQEVRAFYAVNGNRFNCKCGLTECIVDAKGIPTATKTVDKMRIQRLKYFSDEN